MNTSHLVAAAVTLAFNVGLAMAGITQTVQCTLVDSAQQAAAAAAALIH